MPCQNTCEFVLSCVDQESQDELPLKFSCRSHVGDVIQWSILDYSVDAVLVVPLAKIPEADRTPGEERCGYLTDPEIASILDSKRRIVKEIERRHATGEL